MKQRSKKKFFGNQFVGKKSGNDEGTNVRPTPSTPASVINQTDTRKRKANEQSTPLSRSAKKIKLTMEDMGQDNDSFWFFLCSSVLEMLINKIGSCPSCPSSELSLRHNDKRKMGYALNLVLVCGHCNWKYDFYTSPTIDNDDKSPGLSAFVINFQTVLAFREIGKGHEPMKTFNACMNMPRPMTEKNIASINERLFNAYEAVAEKCLLTAATEVRKTPLTKEAEIVNCQVAIDGTWQKRGHASLNGVVVATSDDGKVLDFKVLSKHCKSCQVWSSKEGTPEYEKWKTSHKCKINHKRSAGAMESAGAIAIFEQSISKYKLRYLKYIGDGDTGSFNKVVEARPYGDILPEKLECVGHVQKRLGTRLRKLRCDLTGKKLEDGKKIKGRGRLTDKAINTLQNYFGMAIRQNSSSVYLMKKSIGAVLYHCSDVADATLRHQFCPRTEDSWCKWQKDRLNNTDTYRQTLNLPMAIKTILEPIFRDLSSDDLLKKCLHGQTQNCNEAFNGVLWNKCPKEVFVGKTILELATNSAVIHFNEGFLRLKDVFKFLKLPVNKYMIDGAKRKDAKRVQNATKVSSETGKRQRKKIRAKRKGFTDKETELEGGESYSSGNF